jgi:hypothetical protein
LQAAARVAQGAATNFGNEQHNIAAARQDIERVMRYWT